MSHRWSFRLAYLVPFFVASSGCSSSDLSRGKAESLIAGSQALSSVRLTIPLNQEGWKKGIIQDVWSPDGHVMTKGSKYIRAVDRSSLSLVQPASIVLNVTGISGAESQKMAVFDWNYQDVPATIMRFVVAGGSGQARLRLWDDGWRLEDIQINWSQTPAPQSAVEQKEDQMEQQTALQALEAILLKSQSPTRYSNAFYVDLADNWAGFKTTVVITDTDVRFSNDLFKNHYKGRGTPVSQIWFGDITQIIWASLNPESVRIDWNDHGEGQRYSYSGGTEFYAFDTYNLLKQTLSSAFQEWQNKYGAAIRKQLEVGDPAIAASLALQQQQEAEKRAREMFEEAAKREELERAERVTRDAERQAKLTELDKLLAWRVPTEIVLEEEVVLTYGMSAIRQGCAQKLHPAGRFECIMRLELGRGPL